MDEKKIEDPAAASGASSSTSEYSKLSSRTLWLTIVWVALVPLSIIAQIIISMKGFQIEIPISAIVSFAGGVTTVYVGGNKIFDTIKETQKAKTIIAQSAAATAAAAEPAK